MVETSSEFWEEIDNEKQIRYDERIARELLKLFGIPISTTQRLKNQSLEGVNPKAQGFTPEWVSWYLTCPIIFHAFKDYRLADAEFLSPEQILWSSTLGPKWDRIWTRLWRSVRSEFPSSTYVAVCFRPGWGRGTMVVHNYSPMTECVNLHGMYFAHRDVHGTFYIQYLRDLVRALLEHWAPVLQN